MRARSGRLKEDSFAIYLQELQKTSLLSREEEIKLGRRARQGDEAKRNRLTEANLRFVVSVAKRYQGQGLSMAELVAAGNDGLMKAAKKFDERRGAKLTTYSISSIRHSIWEALAEQSWSVRLPSTRAAIIKRIRKTESRLANKSGEPPALEEIAAELGLPITEVEEAQQLSKSPLRIGVPLDSDGDEGQFELEDSSSLLPDQQLSKRELAQKIQQCLAELSPREAEILELHFGLNGEKSLSLKAIGQRFGLTKERVRQIKDKALLKLRHPRRARRLKPHLV